MKHKIKTGEKKIIAFKDFQYSSDIEKFQEDGYEIVRYDTFTGTVSYKDNYGSDGHGSYQTKDMLRGITRVYYYKTIDVYEDVEIADTNSIPKEYVDFQGAFTIGATYVVMTQNNEEYTGYFDSNGQFSTIETPGVTFQLIFPISAIKKIKTI